MATKLITWPGSPNADIYADGLGLRSSSAPYGYYTGAMSSSFVRRGINFMCEVTVNSIISSPSYETRLGITDLTQSFIGSNTFGSIATEYGYRASGSIITNNKNSSYGASFGPGDIIGILVDDRARLFFAKNGINQGLAYTINNISKFVIATKANLAGEDILFNFGATPFTFPIDGYAPFDQVSGEQSLDFTGIHLDDLPIMIRNTTNSPGLLTDENIHSGIRPIVNNPGLNTDIELINLGKRYGYHSGYKIDPLSPGPRSRNRQGVQVGELDAGSRLFVTFDGISLEPEIEYSSNAEYRYKLLVTPTHQYRNQIISISAKSSLSLIGRYKFEINNEEVISYGASDADLSDITFDVTPGQLITGINYCRITYLYPDSSIEYLEFKILKEEAKRTVVERLFRDYDGGYDGNKITIVSPTALSKAPAFIVPDNQGNTIIKTTNFTSISLLKYTSLQAVTIDGQGLRILVSFDQGITWKSFVDNNWQTIAIDNIATSGMDVDTISTLTLAQWSDVFTPTSLDFAIYLDNSISNYADYSRKILRAESLQGTVYQTRLSPHEGYRLSDVTYILRGSARGSSSQYPTDCAFLYGYVDSSPATNLLSLYSIFYAEPLSGTYVFPEILPYSNYIVYWIGSTMSVASIGPVYEAPLTAYLKSINIQITPRLRMGYAFIM